jgi:hypothetical protein
LRHLGRRRVFCLKRWRVRQRLKHRREVIGKLQRGAQRGTLESTDVISEQEKEKLNQGGKKGKGQ